MQRTVVGFLPVLFLLSLTVTSGAQVFRFPTPTPSPRLTPSATPTPEPKPGPCPTVSVQSQRGQMVRDGQPVSFAANIAGGDPKIQPTMVWNTNAGTIKSGQYTRTIEVDSTGAGASPDREIKAEIWVGGYAPECFLQTSATVKIIPPAVKFGDFGEVSKDVLITNIKALADYLSQSPDNVYLIAYAGRNSERNFTFTWVKRIREELTMAGVAPKRVAALDGGFREEPLFDFWLVPVGAELPRPTPTVRREEIVYPKTTPTPAPKKP